MYRLILYLQLSLLLASVLNICGAHVFRSEQAEKNDRQEDLSQAATFLDFLESTYKDKPRDVFPRRRYPLDQYKSDDGTEQSRGGFVDDYSYQNDLDGELADDEVEQVLNFLDEVETPSESEIYDKPYVDRPTGFWSEIAKGDFMYDEKLRQLMLMTALLEDSIDEQKYKDNPLSEDDEKNEENSEDREQSVDDGLKLLEEEKDAEKIVEGKPGSSKMISESENEPNSDGKKERAEEILSSSFFPKHVLTGDEISNADEAENTRVGSDYAQNDVDELKALLTEMADSTTSKGDSVAEADGPTKQSAAVSDVTIDMKMPGISVNQDDTYLCTTVKITGNGTNPLYIVEYIPHAKQTVAHHMLMYGCTSPGLTNSPVWDCGGNMAEQHNRKSLFPSASVCGQSSSETILWAWAKDAPKFELPENVGFKVGTGTNVKYLVIQVHYKSASIFKGGFKDCSGVSVVASTTPKPRLAGVYVLGSSSGTIPAHQTKDLDIMCRYKQAFPIHPFAFRTHTHALGKLVMGFRVRNHDWSLIGAKNPQLPEAFYPITNKNMTIRYNDWLAARCVMHNFRDVPTTIGYRHTDEMCNFYIMFWVDSVYESQMDSWGKSCSNGFPWVHWSTLFSRYK